MRVLGGPPASFQEWESTLQEEPENEGQTQQSPRLESSIRGKKKESNSPMQLLYGDAIPQTFGKQYGKPTFTSDYKNSRSPSLLFRVDSLAGSSSGESSDYWLTRL